MTKPMMSRRFLLLSAFAAIAVLSCCAPKTPLYKDTKAPVENRVRDLLGRMSPEEKFWQLFMIPGDLGADPSRYRNGLFGFQISASGKDAGAAENTAGKANEIQRYFVDETRLGIPVIFFDEALHGLIREGATAFPQAIGLAATFDPGLVGRVADAVARECRSRGIRQVLSPVVNIATDVRWGRVEETYGEDPFLASEMGAAFVSAFERLGVIATPKHFVANVGDGGRDSYPIQASERWLREVVLPPFEACLRRGGARSIMPAYNSLDGTPCSANDWLLNRLLKKEWNFRGFVISDACAVGGAKDLHLTAAGFEEAGELALEGGLDVLFQTAYDHHALFIKPFLDGRIPGTVIDAAVGRVLRAKFELGLFDEPYVDPVEAGRLNGHPDHRTLALEAARKSIVLLKNDRSVLPLTKNIRALAVIGPDAVEARLGGYSGPGNRKINILEGIKDRLGPAARVEYAPGCGRDAGRAKNEEAAFEEAVRLAARSDASVVVAGIEEGEFRDRARLSLPGRQGDLIRRIAGTGKPVVVVLVGGSAVTMEDWLDRVPAVLDVWYPGEEGGRAVADALFGDVNPAGRLPITFPVFEGQLPLVYNHKPTGRGDDYVDLTGQPLFPFGHGLSYTTFEYGGLAVDPPAIYPDGRAKARFRVKNVGQREGDEVVQLYIRDLLASVARPVMELKGFQRVSLRPGEERDLAFDLTPELLTMLDRNLKPVVEPGDFRVMIGASSKDIRLSGTLQVFTIH